jgi:hypothetical protein
MSADKRTVSTDALETLGTIIGPNEKRDAIHLAVIPVEAGEHLPYGARVGLRDGKAFIAGYDGSGRDTSLGIVDPFLRTDVKPGQNFWLVIYPRVITSLRHVWTHPELPDEPSATRTPGRDASEQWLRNRADSLGISYEEILTAGTNREYPGCFGNDIYGPREIEPEFWIHIQIVTGNAAPADKRPDWFRCAC